MSVRSRSGRNRKCSSSADVYKRQALFLAGFSVAALTGSAQAQVLNQNAVVNLQFAYDAATYDSALASMNGVSSSSTAAPLAYNGNTWNVENLQSTGSSLLYSTGSTSSIGYVVNFLQGGQGGATVLPLLNNDGYAGAPNGVPSGTLTFNNLNNSSSYDITVEVTGDSYFNQTITTGAFSGTLAINANNSTYVNGQNLSLIHI